VTLGATVTDDASEETINIPWTSEKSDRLDTPTLPPDREPDQKLLQAFGRAQVWLS